MAESQYVFPYAAGDIAALKSALSAARFATYLTRAGNDEAYALALYLYNARLAKACLFPLNILEVTLRNAIDESLVSVYGPDWPFDDRFQNRVLTIEGLTTLKKAIDRAGSPASKNQVVATLTFDFWSNLFKPEYGAFWRTKLNVVLPYLPRGETRHAIQSAVKEINQFRNRIAHHEPILDLNATDVVAKIKMIVGYRCPTTAAWMRHHSTVAQAMRSYPDPQGHSGETFASRMDRRMLLVSGAETLSTVLQQLNGSGDVVVRVDGSGHPTGACSTKQIAATIAASAATLDGLVSLEEVKIDAVFGTAEAASHWTTLPDHEPMARAVAILQRSAIRILIGVDASSGRPTGAVLRAHRRY